MPTSILAMDGYNVVVEAIEECWKIARGAAAAGKRAKRAVAEMVRVRGRWCGRWCTWYMHKHTQ